MDSRVDVLEPDISAAFKLLTTAMAKRLEERKNKGYRDLGEIYEFAEQEFDVELLGAMHQRNPDDFMGKSAEVAVTMVLGVATILGPESEDVVDLRPEDISAALKRLSDSLVKRLDQKGRKSFMGMAEIYGTAAEELRLELLQAQMDDDADGFLDEACDVAVAMVFGIASLLARKRYEAANPAKKKGQ